MTPQDHRAGFLAFVAAIVQDVDVYLARPDVDVVRDGVGYRQAVVWASADEMPELARAMREALAPYLVQGGRPDGDRRVLATVTVPRR